MKPVEFTVSKVIPQSSLEVSEGIANVDLWSDYDGHGVIPGIEKAVYEKRTEEMTGSIIRVKNSDGSGHLEEVVEWVWGERIVMRLYDFPMPLNTLVTHFMELWSLEELEKAKTLVIRKFQLFPTNFIIRPIVSQLSSVLKKATIAHLDEMEQTVLKDIKN